MVPRRHVGTYVEVETYCELLRHEAEEVRKEVRKRTGRAKRGDWNFLRPIIKSGYNKFDFKTIKNNHTFRDRWTVEIVVLVARCAEQFVTNLRDTANTAILIVYLMLLL